MRLTDLTHMVVIYRETGRFVVRCGTKNACVKYASEVNRRYKTNEYVVERMVP